VRTLLLEAAHRERSVRLSSTLGASVEAGWLVLLLLGPSMVRVELGSSISESHAGSECPGPVQASCVRALAAPCPPELGRHARSRDIVGLRGAHTSF